MPSKLTKVDWQRVERIRKEQKELDEWVDDATGKTIKTGCVCFQCKGIPYLLKVIDTFIKRPKTAAKKK